MRFHRTCVADGCDREFGTDIAFQKYCSPGCKNRSSGRSVELLSSKPCAAVGCGKLFTPRATHQLFCSPSCRYRQRDAQNPASVHNSRLRSAAWARKNRHVTGSNVWLRSAPPFEPELPLVGFMLGIQGGIIEQKDVRGLHGAITALFGEPHDTVPGFSLAPTGGGWGLVTPQIARARELASKSHRIQIYGRHRELSCGPLVRLKSPRVTRRGRRRLRIDALTPVIVRNSSHGMHWTHVIPTSGNMYSTLTEWLPQRLGLLLRPDETTRLELVSRETAVATTQLGGKHGSKRGWVGHCVVETNATGEWLLRCAELIGLGGRTAFGFGRIRVSEQ